jgi:hypothetical protein
MVIKMNEIDEIVKEISVEYNILPKDKKKLEKTVKKTLEIHEKIHKRESEREKIRGYFPDVPDADVTIAESPSGFPDDDVLDKFLND